MPHVVARSAGSPSRRSTASSCWAEDRRPCGSPWRTPASSPRPEDSGSVPEGDTVYQAARRLRALDGELLTTTDFRVPQHATADLVGARVTTTVSRGKHLLT